MWYVRSSESLRLVSKPPRQRLCTMKEAFRVSETRIIQVRAKIHSQVRLISPVGYLDFLWLMSRARFVMTDSGGIQEETTALSVPCLTLRENTERPITVEQGTNQIVGTEPERIVSAARRITFIGTEARAYTPPLGWQGLREDRGRASA